MRPSDYARDNFGRIITEIVAFTTSPTGQVRDCRACFLSALGFTTIGRHSVPNVTMMKETKGDMKPSTLMLLPQFGRTMLPYRPYNILDAFAFLIFGDDSPCLSPLSLP